MASANELLQRGMKAAKARQVAEALGLLKQLVELEPRNEMAWLWLSEVVGTDEHRIVCLENVLAINPDNQAAQKGLAFLKRRAAATKPLPEGAEEPALKMTTPTTASPEPAESPAVRPQEPTTAPRPWRAEPKSFGKAIGYVSGIGLLLIVTVAIAMWADVTRDRTRTPSGTPTPKRSARWGGDGILHSSSGGPLPVAVDWDAYQELIRAVPRDEYGIQELLLSGRVFAVENGTEVLVIESRSFSYRIRILEGTYTGRDGCVPYEFVDYY